MSSHLRRIEKRIMKAAGLCRRSFRVTDPTTGIPLVIGLIATKEGEIFGEHFPRAIPKRFATRAYA